MSSIGDAAPLIFVVDSDVRLPKDTPRKLILALRRQLRRHDLAKLLAHDAGHKRLATLLASRGEVHVMPQALLPQLTETCRRQGIAFRVDDRRSEVTCAPLRLAQHLSAPQETGLLRLLLRDSGVLVARDEHDRQRLAAALIARRQRRSLIITRDPQHQARWIDTLTSAFGLPASRDEIVRLHEASPSARVAVATYEALTPGALAEHRDAFGLVIFDDVDEVDPIHLLHALRGLTARHLLGLARATTRGDQLHGPLYLVLGGVAHELSDPGDAQALRLSLRRHTTAFSFDYGGRAHYQALVAALALDDDRAALIAEDVAKEARAGHLCLVLSERRDHLTTLLEALPADLSADLVTSDVRPAERAHRVARALRGETRVLLATGQIALESIKIPHVSRLFITFPVAHAQKLERLGALLLAKAPQKRDAIIYDYDDHLVAPLHRSFAKRRAIHERLQRLAEATYNAWAQLSFDL